MGVDIDVSERGTKQSIFFKIVGVVCSILWGQVSMLGFGVPST